MGVVAVFLGVAWLGAATTGCGGRETFAVGGKVLGLKGSGLLLTETVSGERLAVEESGEFVMPGERRTGESYSITVATQPISPAQTCAVVDGSGTVDGADVIAIRVNCGTDAYPLNVEVTGLLGAGLTVRNVNDPPVPVASDGAFALETLESGSTYYVRVESQPTNPWQTCSIARGSGKIEGAPATVQVVCSANAQPVGGTVTGLFRPGLVLENNGEALPVTGSGSFTFTSGVASGSGYAVTVKQQPSDQECVVASGSGTIGDAPVQNVSVSCRTIVYELNGAPDPAKVFDELELTYRFSNNLTNSIWNRQANRILTGDAFELGYWLLAPGSNEYDPVKPNTATNQGRANRMVQIPATHSVVYTDAAPSFGVGQGLASTVRVVTLDTATGQLSRPAQAVFSDSFGGACNLTSSSASEFLCYDGSAIRRYTTSPGSPTLTYVGSISLSQPLPRAAMCWLDEPCYGSTFAFDGAWFYFASHQGAETSRSYLVYDVRGRFVAEYTAAGTGAINGVYFDWSVARYGSHDGFGNRSAANFFNGTPGTVPTDSHSFGPVSGAHRLR
jgi:hypothetical protein